MEGRTTEATRDCGSVSMRKKDVTDVDWADESAVRSDRARVVRMATIVWESSCLLREGPWKREYLRVLVNRICAIGTEKNRDKRQR